MALVHVVAAAERWTDIMSTWEKAQIVGPSPISQFASVLEMIDGQLFTCWPDSEPAFQRWDCWAMAYVL